jgi:hypothetical protein
MALPDVPYAAKIVVDGSFGGHTFAAIQHAALGDVGNVPTQTEMDALATAVRNAWKSTFLPLQANGYQLGQVLCEQLATIGGLTSVATGADSGGDISSGNLPNQVACCVSWLENAHYRGGHPRTYVGGFKQGVMADTVNFSATFRTQMQTAAVNYLAAVNAAAGGNVWHLGCVHYHGKVLTAPGVPRFLPFTGSTVNSRIDTQRRRLGK